MIASTSTTVSTSLGRRYSWLGFLLFAWFNAIAPRALELTEQQGLGTTLTSGAGQSFTGWLCLLVALVLVWRGGKEPAALPRTGTLAVFSLLCLVPLATASWLALALGGIVLLCHPVTLIRAAGLLIAALAIRGPLTTLALDLFAAPLLAFDAQLASTLISLVEPEVQRVDNLVFRASGVNLVILSGCSSLANLSWSLLFWLTVRVYLGNAIPDRMLQGTLAVCALVIALNAVRLALMTLSQAHYELIHGPVGQAAIDNLTLLLVFLLALRASRRSPPHATSD